MKCRVCGCTDNAACPGGCFWVAPELCSKCLPHTLEFQCQDCDHEFDVKLDGDASIIVDGEEVFHPRDIECPECGAGDVLDTFHIEDGEGDAE